MFVLSSASSASANTVTGTCVPPDCNAWHNVDVSLHWTFDPSPPTSTSGCADTTFSTETAGTAVQCEAKWKGGESATGIVNIKIDKTAPTGVGAEPARPPDHNGWYNHPVRLVFGGTDALSGIAGCTTPVYSGPDGPGVAVAGSCTDMAGNASAGTSAAFNYDATPPVVTGLVPSRPPDHNGWYNHPLSYTFTGTDATSGIGSCDGGTYGGTAGANVRVSGTCHDVAGNRDAASFTIKYDDTRPAPPVIHVAPGNRRVDVSWTLPSDAESVRVTRSRPRSNLPPKLIYAGTGKSVLDIGLRNHRKYRYTVVDTDQAGNTNSKSITTVPTASSLRPVAGSAVTSPPLLTWKRVKGARYYNVQIWRGRTKVLSTWPRQPELELSQSWRFRGRKYSLTPGHYRWYVWPGFGALALHRYGEMLGRSSFRVVG